MKKYLQKLLLGNLGFTVTEMVLTMAIVATLFGIITVDLFRAHRSASLSSALQTLVSDIKNQQIKAMTGATTGVTSNNFGIYFTPSGYILFHGAIYNSSDPSNFTIALDSPLSFTSVTFPNNTLLFSQINGNFIGFANGQNTVTIKNTTGGDQKTITINRYGVISNMQ